jgi:hypothetical protein
MLAEDPVGRLDLEKRAALDRALRYALDIQYWPLSDCDLEPAIRGRRLTDPSRPLYGKQIVKYAIEDEVSDRNHRQAICHGPRPRVRRLHDCGDDIEVPLRECHFNDCGGSLCRLAISPFVW